MKHYWMALAAILAVPAYAQTAEKEAPDTSRWKCSKCLSYDGWVGTVEFGVGGVSDDSVDFGRYNGLAEKGAYLHLGSDLAYYIPGDGEGEPGQVWQLRAWDLGLDQRRILLDGGTQGSYRFRLEFDEARIWGPDGTATPYLGNGSESLTLPGGWVRGTTTAGMTSLAGSLRSIELHEDRRSIDVGVDLVASKSMEYSVDYRRETREGMRAHAGGFLFNAVEFAAPVDSVTDTLEASLSYMGEDWVANLSYLGSFYSNEAERVEWENPYASGLGADSGEMALSPDNTFHQVAAATNFQISEQSSLFATLALGQGVQDESFLPYTTNTSLATSTLPRDDLGGRVDTVTATARITHRPTSDWRMQAEFRVNDRYNKTPRASYDYVVTDALLSSVSRTNLPYGFKDRNLGLEAEYRLNRDGKLAVGFDRDQRQRSFQAIEETVDAGVWAKASYRVGMANQLRVRVARSERDATANDSPPAITPADNPLLRKYNLADRSREEIRAHWSSQIGERLSLGIDLGYNSDDYSETQLGLTEATMNDRGLDLSYLIGSSWNLHAAYSRQEVESNQVGNAGSNFNWTLDEEDAVETISFGVSYAPPRTTTRFGADVVQSVSHGRATLDNGGSISAFPLLRTALEQVRFYGVYPWKPAVDITAGLTYEFASADDWALDGVDPATVNNVLALGAESIDYKVWAAFVGLRFRLDTPAE